MTDILAGVRILEVAEHTFVPAASALLADLGADVIKIEHVERGDAMRGLMSSGLNVVGGQVHALLEHSNRGKRSLGLDLATEEGRQVLYRIAATADVFLTNKMRTVREKLHIEVDQIRAANPSIIYVRGTGQGERGPDSDKGSYDSLAFWARAGAGLGSKLPEFESVPMPPGPGFGDSIGGMTIAGGIMGALYHRERTGEATEVDVSLLGTGMWAMGQAIALSDHLGMTWGYPPGGDVGNPLVSNYRTSDDRWVALTCLQAAKYWDEFCRLIGRVDLAEDERFVGHEALTANAGAAAAELRTTFAERPLATWRETLEPFSGQWAVVQDSVEVAADPQAVANGYMQQAETSAGTPFRLVATPVQYDRQPATPTRAPDFNEHCEEILTEIGMDTDEIIQLKVDGVVA